ncbi:MAG: DUF3568 family protein [Deltaproteobacteria bacterium]|nr:DUF3568 family protein [Deltaproteobacteria bacterium]
MKRIICAIPLLLLLAFSGCVPVALVAGAAAGIGGYKYLEGALTVVYNAPFKNTWQASIEAVEDMGIKIEDKDHSLSSGKIKARRTDDTVVSVNMKYLSSDQTEVTIKVGLFGDEKESNNIKDNIAEVLFD